MKSRKHALALAAVAAFLVLATPWASHAHPNRCVASPGVPCQITADATVAHVSGHVNTNGFARLVGPSGTVFSGNGQFDEEVPVDIGTDYTLEILGHGAAQVTSSPDAPTPTPLQWIIPPDTDYLMVNHREYDENTELQEESHTLDYGGSIGDWALDLPF